MYDKLKETFKKFGWSIASGLTCITAVVLSYIIRERSDPYRKRAREIEDLVDTAGDYNKSAKDGVEDAIGILQKARKRQDKV